MCRKKMANMEDPEMVHVDELLLLEKARRTAENNYTINPYDADNLTNLGVTLLELSRSRGDTPESKRMIKEAISMLKEALDMEPKKHKAVFYLGNAYIIQGLQIHDDPTIALALFDKAFVSYQKALHEDPGNEQYKDTLAACARIPMMYTEFQLQHGVIQPTQAQTQSSTTANNFGKKKNNDLWYDVGGWILLGIGIMAWIGMSRTRPNVPPPF
ncbi:hypothetical protein ACH5RR_005213 [Cinchona calisaya]|uniref:Mitochondrial import receptor subunit TOM20 n=1 Tax=Cinchona calisaya TaxID=153742 RepID=A0ABD3AKI1_9GENT